MLSTCNLYNIVHQLYFNFKNRKKNKKSREEWVLLESQVLAYQSG